jgi:hypothetical protein
MVRSLPPSLVVVINWYQNVTRFSPCLLPTGTASAHPARGQGNYVQYQMSQQKSTEFLFSLPLMKHTLAELPHGIARAVHVQKTFESLVLDLASVQCQVQRC